MSEIGQLREEDIRLLYDSRQLDDPVLVEADVGEGVADGLAQPLEALGMRESAIEEMSLEALAGQFVPSDDDDDTQLVTLSQMPETGGQDAAEAAAEVAGNADQLDSGSDDDEDPIDALSASATSELASLHERYNRMKNRTPKHAESLAKEMSDILGVESFDEVDQDRLDDLRSR